MNLDDDLSLGGSGLGGLFSGLLDATKPKAPQPEPEAMASDVHKRRAMEAAARLKAAETRWSTAIGSMEREKFGMEENLQVMRSKHRNETGLRRQIAIQAIRGEMQRIQKLTDRIGLAKQEATNEIHSLDAAFQEVRDGEQEYLHAVALAPDVSPKPDVHQVYQKVEDIEDTFSVPFGPVNDGVEGISFNIEEQTIKSEFSRQEHREMNRLPQTFDPAMEELVVTCRGTALARKKCIQRYHDTGDEDLKEVITDRERVFQNLKGAVTEMQTIDKAKHDVGPSWVPLGIRRYARDIIEGSTPNPHPLPRGTPPNLPQPTDDLDQYVDHVNALTDTARALQEEYSEAARPPRPPSRIPENMAEMYNEDRFPDSPNDFQERYRAAHPGRGDIEMTAASTVGQGRRPPPWREGQLPNDVLRQLDRKGVETVPVLLGDLTIKSSGDLGQDIGRSPISDLQEDD